ncbi:glycosyltransferase family 39 protein [Flavobacterium sp. GT3R68]|uniref:glycosyltransferase family 39 protein n=1 Tax=Flavobacterium sp. GT3R68 TaxID=2594437 RepID=UPI001C8FA3BD|nr:glycosyltransferase family 39 protein [Flavobacterium sp. GT3R68]
MKNSDPKLTLKQFYDGIMFWEFIPHLYFLLLRFVFEVFGYSTLVARVFSGVIGVVGIYAIYLFAKELFNKRSGLIAAALLSVNIFHISYSQEMRPYGMLFLFTVMAFYRLVIFIKKPTILHAVYYGIFAGLIVNSHFFGFITIFSQYLILLFFLITSPKENKKTFFFYSFISGIVTLIIFLPAYEAIIRVSEISSFWLQKPGPDAFTMMFKEFFGNSEIILFIINFIVIFYVINLFKEKTENYKHETILNNKILFSFIILFIWLFTSLVIPLLRSYLDVPMILSRYFINILPVLVLVITIGMDLIKNKLIKCIVISCFVLFSLIDLFVVKNYYNTVTKSQFRELTKEITRRNPEKSKIVAYWSWLFPYFFANTPDITIEGNSYSLKDYVAGMKSGAIKPKAFWYADANSRPYTLTVDGQAYLDKNFILKEKLEFHDAWANYYAPIAEEKINLNENLDLSIFKPVHFDGNGNIILFENTNARSEFITLEKGNYDLIISGNSLPAKPINGENAHLKFKLNGVEIGNLNLSENTTTPEKVISFNYNKNEKVRIQFIYDNDIFEKGQDRNAIIYSLKLKKK